MARQAEATQVAELGEDRELRKYKGTRNSSRNNDVVEESRFSIVMEQREKSVASVHFV
jgi:hypothetical protein